MKRLLIFLLIAGRFLMATDALDFSELKFEASGIPSLEHYSARDQTRLEYRVYDVPSETVLILLHGSASHSRYFYPLAQALSQEGAAKVYTPNLRGHGENPAKRGDVDYIGQLEDDLADFIAFVRSENPHCQKVLLGGHSSGGGLAVLFAGGKQEQEVDGYLLFAPYLKYDAPTTRKDASWAQPKLFRIIGLSLLNACGIHWFDHATTITFAMPEEMRDGTETLEYSHALISSYSPVDYEKDLRAMTQPTLILVGSKDEMMVPEAYEKVAPQGATVDILPGVSHMGIVVRKEAQEAILAWVKILH